MALRECDNIVVYGAGGHAKVVLDILEQQRRYRIIGLIDDDPRREREEFFGYPVLGNQEALQSARTSGITGVIIAVGDNTTRDLLAHQVLAMGFELVTAIHPAAQISRGVEIGVGCAVMAGAVINASSILGANIIVNTGATIDHDCRVGACVHLSPGVHLAGGVEIEHHALLGMGAVVLPGLTVGHHAIVGAGSVVNVNLPPGVVAIGVPVRVHREAGRAKCPS
jgi:sugar O-acyltransferase (sialic acid O-acetyltransferase NeuD family)